MMSPGSPIHERLGQKGYRERHDQQDGHAGKREGVRCVQSASLLRARLFGRALRSDNSSPLTNHHFNEADEDGRNWQAKHDRLRPHQEIAKLVVVLCWVEPVRQREDDEGRPKQPPQTSQTEPSCTRYHCVALCAPMTKLASLP
jgi:hypothetical protein